MVIESVCLLAYIIYIVFSHCSSSVGSFTCYLFIKLPVRILAVIE